MPGPPAAGQKFVVCIEIDGPISREKLEELKADLRRCAEKSGAHVVDNRLEGPRKGKGKKR